MTDDRVLSTEERLRELAIEGAQHLHVTGIGLRLGHHGQGDTCPHPDCVLVRAAAGSPSAGDLYIVATETFMEHANGCGADECQMCVTNINQLRLARKVWQASAHKSAAVSPAPGAPQEGNAVVVCAGAVAGFMDAVGGDSGAIRIELTDHEIGDMIASGQAYSRDGKYNFLNESSILEKLGKTYWSAASGSAPAASPQEKP